jgi:hypothetical protein
MIMPHPMLIRRAMLERIRRGEVTLAFRRWRRPTVKSGGQLRTALGVVAIESVTHIESRAVSEDDALKAGFASRHELLQSLREEGGLYRVELSFVGDDPRLALREKPLSSKAERDTVLDKLSALDRRAQDGPYTRRFLRLIADGPGRAAALLSVEVGMETLPFKARVRKLKELGLTESLEVGSQLSPRGRGVLDELERAAHAKAEAKLTARKRRQTPKSD